ncbi:amidohydrolase family protein [Streptomyces sp. KE1]|uniref:amidohydrolase family protein n=1 Tax=Streptomyces sp. KE1 TaxID=1638939 RepID=UPI00069E096A|nr:amidohydrolase family protein [Streptomyces sp. KE1]
MGRGPDDDPAVGPEHVAEVLRGLYYDTALAGSPHALLPALETTGPGHVLFCTGWPAAPEPTWSARSPPSPASPASTPDAAEQAGVERGNAARLFPRLA